MVEWLKQISKTRWTWHRADWERDQKAAILSVSRSASVDAQPEHASDCCRFLLEDDHANVPQLLDTVCMRAMPF